MNKIRLLKLAELMETVAKSKSKTKKFDINDWISVAPFSIEVGKEINVSCGTAACACGWAASDPWFNKKGLKVITNRFYPVLSYKDTEGVSAAEKFFNISFYDAEMLFLGDSYDLPENVGRVTPGRVARRIRKYVETGKFNLNSKVY